MVDAPVADIRPVVSAIHSGHRIAIMVWKVSSSEIPGLGSRGTTIEPASIAKIVGAGRRRGTRHKQYGLKEIPCHIRGPSPVWRGTGFCSNTEAPILAFQETTIVVHISFRNCSRHQWQSRTERVNSANDLGLALHTLSEYAYQGDYFFLP